MRRVLLTTLGALVAALVLSAVAAVALLHGWQRDWLREQLESRLSEALAAPVAIASLDGVLYRDVTLRGLRIGEDAAPLVSASSLRVRLGSLQLSPSPAVTLDAVALSGVHVTLRQSAQGGWPWEASGTEQSELQSERAWPLLLWLRSVVVENARLEFVREAGESIWIDLSGELSGAGLDAEPSIEDARLLFSATGPERRDEPWMKGRGSGSYSAGRWQLAELQVEGPVLELEGRGSGDQHAIESAHFSVTVPSIAALAERVLGQVSAVSGSIAMSASLEGAYRWPRGSFELDARGLSTEAIGLGDVHVEARLLEEGRLRIEALRLEHGPLEVTADSGADIVADAERARLEPLRLRQTGGSGTLSIDASIPRAASGSLAALGRDLETRVALRSTAWPLATLQPLWDGLGLDVAGSLDADLVVSGAAEGPGVAGQLRLSRAQLGFASGNAQGIDLELRLAGPVAQPAVSATGSVARLSVAGQALGALELSAQTSDGRTILIDRLLLRDGPAALRVVPQARLRFEERGVRFESLVIEGEGQRIALSGGLFSDRAEALRLELAPLDMARSGEILQALGLLQVDADLSGKLVGHVVGSGSRQRPELAGRLEWSDARLGEFGFGQIDVIVETHDAQLRITSDWKREGASVLNLDATLPRDRLLQEPDALLFDPRTRVVARTEGFELGALAPFLPQVVADLGGALTARVEAQGRSPLPRLSGDATIEKGSVQLQVLGGRKLAPISARLALTDDRLVLERLTIGEAKSGVQGTGELRLAAMVPQSIDLNLAFEAFPLEAPGLVRGIVSGPLRLAGTRDALELSGEIALANLQIQIPEPQDVALKEIRIVSSGGEDPQLVIRERDGEASLLDPLRVDLGIEIAKNSWARGRGAEAELRGKLRARKQRRLPLELSGTVETVRGTYEIYGRRFRIERGQAVLDGTAEVDPVLDVRALHRVRGVRILAIVEGRLSEPHLRLESDPELGETDIASYLLLGRPAAEATTGQEAALDAAAAQIAAGAALREFERLFGGSLPVDLVDVRVEEVAGQSEIHTGVGKYVGDRLFLHYERGFGREPQDELKAEYELTPGWSVESNVSGEGATGADVIFEIEY